MKGRGNIPLLFLPFNSRIMKILFSIAFLGFSRLCFSQMAESELDSALSAEPWTWSNATKFVKFTPLDVFSVVPTLGLDYEVKMKNETSLQAGIGYIPSFLQIMSGEGFNDYTWMRGYRLRLEGRLFMPVRTNQYLAFGASFRHLIIKDDVALGMEAFTDNQGQTDFAYFVNTPMVFNRFSTNFDLKYGFQREFSNVFIVDFFMGLSLRNINVQSNTKIPDGAQVPPDRGAWTLVDNHKLTYPIPIMGFKIGFVAPSWMGGK